MFDPYHKWLGIPPKDQPANYYRLLGLDLFENDPDVIANAADQRMAHVRSFQIGTYQGHSQKLLNELAAARVCLLNQARKVVYDDALRARLAGEAPPMLEVLEPIHDDHEEFDFAPTPQRIYRPRKRLLVTPWTVAGVSVVIAVVVLYLVARSTPESKQIANAATSETKAQAVAATAKPKVEPPPVAPAVVPESRSEPQPEEPKPQQEAKPSNVVAPLSPEKAPTVTRRPTGRRPRVTKVPDKLPVPNATVVKQARDSIRNRYRSDYNPDISPTAYRAQQESRNQLIKKLIQASKETKDTTERFALLQEARELAEKSFGFSLTNEAIDLLAAYEISASRMKANYLCKFLECVQPSPEGRATIAEMFLPVVEEAIREDNFVDARRLCDSLAKFARDTPVLKEIMAERSKVDRIAADYEVVKEAYATLKVDPGNYEAHNTIGEYLCLVQHDCDRGIPYLLGGNDLRWKSLADWDATGTDSPEEQQDLGNAWWDLGVRNRAIQWYELAYPKLTGEEKDAVAERLAEIPLDRSNWVDLLARVDMNRDRVEGYWVRGSKTISISDPEPNARLVLPVTANGEYDLQIQFLRRDGDGGVGVMLPVGKKMCLVSVAIGGDYGGLELIDGKHFGSNSVTQSPCSLENDQLYSLTIKVRRKGSQVSIDAGLEQRAMLTSRVQVCHWEGKEESLSLDEKYKLPKSGCFGLLASCDMSFHSATLRIISGAARWLPSALPIRNPYDEERAEQLLQILDPSAYKTESDKSHMVITEFTFFRFVPCKPVSNQDLVKRFGRPDGVRATGAPRVSNPRTKRPWQMWTYGSMKILVDDTGMTRYVTQPEERK